MKQITLILLFFVQSFIANAQCACNYTYGGNSDTLYFSNLSVLSNAHYYWNFGDGQTSYSINPTHIFPESGKYLVTLYGKDTLSGCHTYYETWILVTKPSINSCQPLLHDSLIAYNNATYTEIKDLSTNCNNYSSNFDAGPAQNFSPGNWINLTGWSSYLLSNRLQFYSTDSITGFVLQREYYKTQRYNYSSFLNYDACSANFEYYIDLQANGAMVHLKAMNQNAISYKFVLTGMGNPIYINSSSGSHLYQYVTYEKYFPWSIGLYTEDIGGCKDTVWQIIHILNPYYKTPPTCAIGAQPQNQTVFSGNNAQFIIQADPLAHKQWQQDAGLGFVNLTNAGPYNGVNTDTLTIFNMQPTMNNYHYRCIVSENFSNCHNTSSTAVLNFAVGIKEYDFTSLKIHPNPVSTNLIIESENNDFESSVINITNSIGQIVLTSKFSNQLNVSDLAGGIYSLKIKTKDGSIYYTKFVKEE